MRNTRVRVSSSASFGETANRLSLANHNHYDHHWLLHCLHHIQLRRWLSCCLLVISPATLPSYATLRRGLHWQKYVLTMNNQNNIVLVFYILSWIDLLDYPPLKSLSPYQIVFCWTPPVSRFPHRNPQRNQAIAPPSYSFVSAGLIRSPTML